MRTSRSRTAPSRAPTSRSSPRKRRRSSRSNPSPKTRHAARIRRAATRIACTSSGSSPATTPGTRASIRARWKCRILRPASAHGSSVRTSGVRPIAGIAGAGTSAAGAEGIVVSPSPPAAPAATPAPAAVSVASSVTVTPPDPGSGSRRQDRHRRRRPCALTPCPQDELEDLAESQQDRRPGTRQMPHCSIVSETVPKRSWRIARLGDQDRADDDPRDRLQELGIGEGGPPERAVLGEPQVQREEDVHQRERPRAPWSGRSRASRRWSCRSGRG